MSLPVGVFAQRLRHVRSPVEERASLLTDDAQCLARFEAFLQHDAAAVSQQIEQCVLATESPEQRYREPEPVVLGDVHALADLPHVFDQRVMLKLHALRRRGRARCVKQISDVFWVDGARRVFDLGIRHSAAACVDVVERN